MLGVVTLDVDVPGTFPSVLGGAGRVRCSVGARGSSCSVVGWTRPRSASSVSMAGSIILLLREGREGLGLGLGIPLWGLLLLCGIRVRVRLGLGLGLGLS